MIKINAVELLQAEHEVFGMSDFKSDSTGLPNSIYIWIDIGGSAIQHGPRIKISNVRGKFRKDDAFSVSIPTGDKQPEIVFGAAQNFSPKELKAIDQWIMQNKNALLTLWRSDDLDDDDARKMLNKLKAY